MGYKIQYGQTAVKSYISERKKLNFSGKPPKIIITMLGILLAFVLGSLESVQNFIIPGNSQVTKAAMSQMVSDLKEGEPLSASFEAFCREIIDGANIPQ